MYLWLRPCIHGLRAYMDDTFTDGALMNGVLTNGALKGLN